MHKSVARESSEWYYYQGKGNSLYLVFSKLSHVVEGLFIASLILQGRCGSSVCGVASTATQASTSDEGPADKVRPCHPSCGERHAGRRCCQNKPSLMNEISFFLVCVNLLYITHLCM